MYMVKATFLKGTNVLDDIEMEGASGHCPILSSACSVAVSAAS